MVIFGCEGTVYVISGRCLVPDERRA